MDRKRDTEGIPLRAIEYQERRRIVTLFTEKWGLVTLIIKNISSEKPLLLTLSTPLCIGEFHYLQGKSELHQYQDGTLLNPLPSVRTSYAHLSAATRMTSLLLKTQLPEKTTPMLYYLLKAYLLHLHTTPMPQNLAASFHLKLLLHDGYISLTNPPFPFSPSEWKTLLPFVLSKYFSTLPQDPIAPALLEKLCALTPY